ncbi:MAG: hypothetical protein IT424_12840 [Pirellulales bacterium]|nr:hypothetical protein [Pirellulales bacterium]
MLGDTRRKILRFGATGFAVAALTVAVGLPAFAAGNNNTSKGISANLSAQIEAIKSKTGNSAHQDQDSKQVQVNNPDQKSDQDNYQKAIVPTSAEAKNINKSGDAKAIGAISDVNVHNFQASSADAKGVAVSKNITGDTGNNRAGGYTGADGGGIAQKNVPITGDAKAVGISDSEAESGDSKAVNATGDADGGKGVGVSDNNAHGGGGGDTGDNDPDSSGNNTATNIGALLGSAGSGATGNSSDVDSGDSSGATSGNTSTTAGNGGAGGKTGANDAASKSVNTGDSKAGSTNTATSGSNAASTNNATGANGGKGGDILAGSGDSGNNASDAIISGGTAANGLVIVAPVKGNATATSGTATNNGDATADPCVDVTLVNKPDNNQDQANILKADNDQDQGNGQTANSTNNGGSQDSDQDSSNDSSQSTKN